MAANPILEALAPLGLKTLGKCSMGCVQGYPVSVQPAGNGVTYQVSLAVRVNKKDRALPAQLKKAYPKPAPKIMGVLNFGDRIAVNLNFNKKLGYAEQLSGVLRAFIPLLEERGIAPANTCAVCGRRHPESLGWIGSYQPLHASCVRSQLEQSRSRAEDNETNGSYILGLIGALLGVIVGSIPSVLTIVFIERIFSLLFALVPLCAAFGYRLFKGKQNKASIVIVIVLSLLGVLGIEALTLAVFIAQEYGGSVFQALGPTVLMMFDPEVFVELLPDLGQMLLFMALGVWISWRFINKTNSGTVQNMELAASTLSPNPNEDY